MIRMADYTETVMGGVRLAIGVGVAAFVLGILAYTVYVVSNNGNITTVQQFFSPVGQYWPIMVTLGMLGGAIFIIIPVITKLMGTFGARGG